MDFDEIKFKDEIKLMNLQKQLTKNQEPQTYGFNLDTIYNEIENKNINL